MVRDKRLTRAQVRFGAGVPRCERFHGPELHDADAREMEGLAWRVKVVSQWRRTQVERMASMELRVGDWCSMTSRTS